MVDDTFMRQALQDDHLKTVPDLTRIVKKLTRGKASLQDVARVYQAVLRLGAIVECLRTAGGDSSNEAQRTSLQEEYVGPLSVRPHLSLQAVPTRRQEFEAKLAPYSEMVETTLDLEELDRWDCFLPLPHSIESERRNNYVIRPEFSEDLQEVKTQLDDVKEQLDAEHEAVADDLGMSMDQKTLHFEKNDKHGWCFRLTRKEAGILTQGDNADKYIQLQTKNNGTAFITKKLRRLQGEHADLQAKYDKKQSGLVKEVVAIAASYCEVLLPLNALLAHLDVIVSYGRFCL
jgi:DNA mismatch repair protein MSH2